VERVTRYGATWSRIQAWTHGTLPVSDQPTLLAPEPLYA
jgi:hypothetical protein